MFSIVIPLIIIALEIRGVNFSEILSIFTAKFFHKGIDKWCSGCYTIGAF